MRSISSTTEFIAWAQAEAASSTRDTMLFCIFNAARCMITSVYDGTCNLRYIYGNNAETQRAAIGSVGSVFGWVT